MRRISRIQTMVTAVAMAAVVTTPVVASAAPPADREVAQAGAVPTAVPTAPSSTVPGTFTPTRMEFSKAEVAPVGLSTVPVTLTVQGTWVGNDREMPTKPVIILKGTGTLPDQEDQWVELSRVAGTPADGTYQGTIPVPSTWNGTYRVAKILPLGDWDHEPQPPVVVVPDGPTLRVTGSHIPALVDLKTDAKASAKGAFTARGRLIDRATGTGYASPVKLAICDSDPGSGYRTIKTVVTAPRTGVFSTRVTDGSRYQLCVGLAAYAGGRRQLQAEFPFDRLSGTVTAKPVSSSVRLGRTVGVRGRAVLSDGMPADLAEVQLQRQYRRGVWRTVSTSSMRESGDFRLVAQPPTRGKHVYRVHVPETRISKAFTSKPFVIRAV